MYVFQSKYRNFDTQAGGKPVLFRDYRFVTESEELANALRKNCGADYYDITPGRILTEPENIPEFVKKKPGRPKVIRGARTSEVMEQKEEV